MKTKETQLITGRREALKLFGLGTAALLSGGFGKIPSIDIFDSPEIANANKPLSVSGRTSVAFTTGTDRRAMMSEVLKPFEAKIREDIKGKQIG